MLNIRTARWMLHYPSFRPPNKRIGARVYSVVIWLMLLSAAASSSYAGLIGTWTTLVGAGPINQNGSDFRFLIDIFAPLSTRPSLFEGLVWTVADVGRTVTATSITDDPDFSKITDTLTNGIDDYVEVFSLAGGGGRIAKESFAFGTTPDFAGFQIDAISLTLDSLMSFPDPNPDFPDYLATMTADIYGTPEIAAIPEPPTAVFICSGLGLFLVSWRCKRILSRPRLDVLA